MFDRWLVAGAAPAVDLALASIGPARAGRVTVVGDVRLARALASRGRQVALADADERARRRPPASLTLIDAVEDRSAAALVVAGVGDRPDWEVALAAWSRAVVDGGGLVLVDRAAATEVSRRALCAGLTELEQRTAGRWLVTSGLVSAL